MTPSEIRRARKMLGMTKTQLAARINVSLRTVDRWEKGTSAPIPLAVDALRSLLKDTFAGTPEPELVEKP